jgi:hypothetical protein
MGFAPFTLQLTKKRSFAGPTHADYRVDLARDSWQPGIAPCEGWSFACQDCLVELLQENGMEYHAENL